jgi:hypothetical protein
MFPPTGRAVGVLDGWLQCAVLTPICEEELGTVLRYILLLVRSGNVCVLRWLSHLLLVLPHPMHLVWDNACFFSHLLTAICGVCVAAPAPHRRLTGLLRAALPVVVQLLASAALQHKLAVAVAAGCSGTSSAATVIVGLDVDLVVQFAGVVEEDQVASALPGDGWAQRRTEELAAELAVVVRPLLALWHEPQRTAKTA